MSEKSVLDSIPVKITGTTSAITYFPKPHLGVVSSCPSCGCPIYGPQSVVSEEPANPISIRFSCSCHQTTKSVIQTKEG